jgi:formamidopyrimidine-DNA glycosylase
MPELPEVETYVRELEPEIKGRQITAAHIYWERTIAAPAPDKFAQTITGQRFQRFGRRGKYMLLELDGGDTLIVHLRMTGHLYVEPGDTRPTKHTHVVLDLDDGRTLHYVDSRKFGRMWLASDPDLVLHKLGPEPLEDQFTPAVLARSLAGRQAPIKALLLDQQIVAGLGNIYADEALFHAGIHPTRPGGSLTLDEIERLHAAIADVLARGIDRQGSSLGLNRVQNYVRPGGESGGFQEEFQVFRRTGQPCPHCGQPIERIVVSQRSTHFCPQCQE